MPPEQLPTEVLQNLMEDFIGREGTDYGEHALPMETKMERLRNELQSGSAVIVYHLEDESCNIVSARDLARH